MLNPPLDRISARADLLAANIVPAPSAAYTALVIDLVTNDPQNFGLKLIR